MICGDINTAHKEIDLARPKANEKISGFLPVERAWMDRLVEKGFVDTFSYLSRGGRELFLVGFKDTSPREKRGLED